MDWVYHLQALPNEAKEEKLLKEGNQAPLKKEHSEHLLEAMRSIWGHWNLRYDIVAFFVNEQSLKNED